MFERAKGTQQNLKSITFFILDLSFDIVLDHWRINLKNIKHMFLFCLSWVEMVLYNSAPNIFPQNEVHSL